MRVFQPMLIRRTITHQHAPAQTSHRLGQTYDVAEAQYPHPMQSLHRRCPLPVVARDVVGRSWRPSEGQTETSKNVGPPRLFACDEILETDHAQLFGWEPFEVRAQAGEVSTCCKVRVARGS
jgi:hypothetical protein